MFPRSLRSSRTSRRTVGISSTRVVRQRPAPLPPTPLPALPPPALPPPALPPPALPPRALPPPAFRQLPFEILDMIFHHTVAPNFLLDSSLTAGPNSPWCHARNMKLALALVSHTWYAPGIALLYKEVVFRRLNQIPALLETLEKSPSVFGVLVKQITLDMFVSPDYGASFTRNMQRIVNLCPRLEGFIYSSPFPLPTKAFFPQLKSPLRHLQVDASVSPTELYDLLKYTRKSLVSLSIHVHDPPEHFATPKIYSLPQLESLTIKIAYAGVDAWPLLSHILIMPELQRLTFELFSDHDSATEWSLSWNSMIEPITSFCERYENLKFLNINPGFRRKAGDVQGLLDACPKLEHIVLYNGATLESHPTLKWVDICTSKMFGPDDDSRWIHDAALNRLRKSVTPITFPALQGTRHLHICSPRLLDIATKLSPDSVPTPSEAYELDFPGIYVRHEHGFALTERYVDVGGEMYEDPLYLDIDYPPHCDTDDGRSDGTTSASERSLARLRRREVDGCDDDSFESSSLSSECTTRVNLLDSFIHNFRAETRTRH
ncbi:hypothetical protein E4T56_gene11106 [Termitomyces sp. T112]|nr:hypothetical protein E4T56_gene11106 [Termitomyces sp. T112]